MAAWPLTSSSYHVKPRAIAFTIHLTGLNAPGDAGPWMIMVTARGRARQHDRGAAVIWSVMVVGLDHGLHHRSQLDVEIGRPDYDPIDELVQGSALYGLVR